MPEEQEQGLPLVAGAAEASSERTAAAIDEAANKNDDPEVAEALDDAAVAAQTTVGRVGWLRKKLTRLFGPHD